MTQQLQRSFNRKIICVEFEYKREKLFIDYDWSGEMDKGSIGYGSGGCVYSNRMATQSIINKRFYYFKTEKIFVMIVNFPFTVNLRTYCARNYIIQGREVHASNFNRDIERAFIDRDHRWSKEMKKYDVPLKRIEKRLDGVFEQNQQMQKRIKRVNHKPNQHASEIQLLLYLEEKKRA